MASDKENIADGLLASIQSPAHTPKSPLPARKSGRSRSKSIGPHSNLTVPIKFEDAANRRKSAILPGMRSILSAQDDEDAARKRKEARRKSLANRRVSFAPEATLHTWDVIEYMRGADSTTSSSTSSSNNSLNSSTRRSPSKSPERAAASSLPAQSDAEASPGHESPSTPPEQAEDEAELITSSPANQREAHQKKRRRSSTGGPSTTANDAEDVYSSSPVTGSSSPAAPSEEADDSESDSDDGVDETETGMSMDLSEADVTVRSVASEGSNDDSTGSSARLDEALRQAARQAGTQGIEYDETGEASMEMAGDEVTNAFVPFVRQQQTREDSDSPYEDKENVDPFNPAKRAASAGKVPQPTLQEDEDGMSMDITRAVGGILPQSNSSDPNQSSEDGTMDFTMVMPGSGILNGAAPQDSKARSASLKRRRSSLAQSMSTDETGSPAKKPATGRRQSLRASRRRSSMAQVDDEAGGEETMELTANLGAIQEEVTQQLLQEQMQQSQILDLQEKTSGDGNQHRLSMDNSFGDEPMDMTMVVGSGIARAADVTLTGKPEDTNEDLSMEFTTALGVIAPAQPASPEQATNNAVQTPAEAQAQQWKFPSPEQASTAIPNGLLQQSEEKDSPSTPNAVPSKSPKRRTPRKSIVPATPEAQKEKTPQKQSSRQSSARKAALANIPPAAKPVDTVVSKTPEADPAPMTTMVADTPIGGVQLPETHLEAAMAEPSPTPKNVPPQALPPPVRSPLAPKNDSFGNAAPAPKLSDSIKQLATPRKQMSASPLKKVMAASTPKTVTKSPKKGSTPAKTRTPRKGLSPRKRVRVVEEDKENAEVMEVEEDVLDEEDEPRIPLQDFLNMTGIQFMDLRTTKRRHTGFPGAKGAALFQDDEDESAGGDGMDSLERTVVAATVTAPNIEMYKHSCQEMNTYIASGRDLVQEMDDEVLAEPPPLFREYLQAPPKERQIMDDQFRAMKAYARLESKGSWYQWRSQLLKDLTRGLDQAKSNMEKDETVLHDLEHDAGSSLETLRAQQAELVREAETLRRRKEERDSDKREELEEARGILSELKSSLVEKNAVLDELRKQVQEQDEALEILQERKEESLGAIKEANRVREESRGWSSDEVNSVSAQMQELEDKHHWSLQDATASPSTVTLTYRGEVELFFHPLAFADAQLPTASPAKAAHANQSISLNYVAKNKAGGELKEVSTTQRFFLQLLRAQLFALPQPRTTISSLLKLVAQGWDTCTALCDGISYLEVLGMTDVAILGDEVIGIKTAVVLPDVATKVMVRFAVSVAIEDTEMKTKVQSNVKVSYGERYDEPKMTDFLKGLVGEELLPKDKMSAWADAVGDLRARLIKRGRKG